MKTLILILILLSFLQVTFISLNLVLLVLVIRSFLKVDKSNLYLAFAFGLLLSLLNFYPLGIESLIMVLTVELVQLVTKSPLSDHFLVVVPLSLAALMLNYAALALFLHQSLSVWPAVVFEVALVIPIYIVMRVWDERFVIHSEIKLKI